MSVFLKNKNLFTKIKRFKNLKTAIFISQSSSKSTEKMRNCSVLLFFYKFLLKKRRCNLFCIVSFFSYFVSNFIAILSSSNCSLSTIDGAFIITSRPELFLGKAIQSRMLSNPAKRATNRSNPKANPA